jgi:hypothetical protein
LTATHPLGYSVEELLTLTQRTGLPVVLHTILTPLSRPILKFERPTPFPTGLYCDGETQPDWPIQTGAEARPGRDGDGL